MLTCWPEPCRSETGDYFSCFLGITIGIHASFPFGHEYAERQEGNVYARNVFSNLPSLYRGSLRRRVIGLQGPHELAQSSKRQSAEFLPDPYLQALCESSVHISCSSFFTHVIPRYSPFFFSSHLQVAGFWLSQAPVVK